MKHNIFDITVIIANYNYAQYIEQCLESVLDSDFDVDNMEIIVVDNASTDNSIGKIERFILETKVLIRLLKNDTNLGLIKAKNRGIVNAAGEYVFILDTDNYIQHDCIRLHYEKMISDHSLTACNTPISNFLNQTGEYLDLESNRTVRLSTIVFN